MKIKARYENREDIPEEFAGLYSEINGGWELTGVEGIKTADDVARVQDTLKKERELRRAAERNLKQYQGLGEFDSLLEMADRFPELEALAAGKADDDKIQEIAEKRASRLINPLKRDLEALKAERDELAQTNQKFIEDNRVRTIEDHVRQAATKAKVRDTALDDVLMYARANFTVEEGAVIANDASGLGGYTPDAWLGEMADKKPHWWPTPTGGGAQGAGGAPGSVQKNPFAGENWNITEGMKLYKTRPAEAKRLAVAAGKDPAELGMK